jgi:hypothetical protein
MAENIIKKTALAGLIAIGTLAVATTSASAYVACNRWHECWHVGTQPAYPARIGIHVYPDAWRTANPTGYRWRGDRDEHGYYYHGHWRRF